MTSAADGSDPKSAGDAAGSGSGSGTAAAAGGAAAGEQGGPEAEEDPSLPAAVRGGIPPHVPVGITKADLLTRLPPLAEVSLAERGDVLLLKLRLGCIALEWPAEGEPDPEAAEREAKHALLLDLVESIGKCDLPFTEPILSEVVRLATTNLFRTLTALPVPETGGGESEEEPLPKDPAWPHLHIVYEFFLRFIVSAPVDPRVMKKHINGPFVLRLLTLFNSQDYRERDYLKTLLHRIYAKFMSLRAFIRKAMNHVFFEFIYVTEQWHGVGEMLEILGSIINGFALPLKQEPRNFFTRVLLPMHKVRPLVSFHHQLSYCVTQFVEKDPTLATPLILGILRYWPLPCSSKELLFIAEIEEVLELTPVDEFQRVARPLFQQIARCIVSPHFQVSERALYLWQNNYVGTLISEHRATVLPLVYAALHDNEDHWNDTVSSLARSVLNIFSELDPALLSRCEAELEEERSSSEAVAARRAAAWAQIEQATGEVVGKYPTPPPLHSTALLPP